MNFRILSSAFKNYESIPRAYTCDGRNISPPLNWNDPPEGTKSLVLINDDPDAPSGDWVHWIVYNIPPDIRKFNDNQSAEGLPGNCLQGRNDFGKIGYGGPCPPSGTHRYSFKLYALDIMLNVREGLTKNFLLEMISGHIVATTELVGKYSRRDNYLC